MYMRSTNAVGKELSSAATNCEGACARVLLETGAAGEVDLPGFAASEQACRMRSISRVEEADLAQALHRYVRRISPGTASSAALVRDVVNFFGCVGSLGSAKPAPLGRTRWRWQWLTTRATRWAERAAESGAVSLVVEK